jgi:hypothetical protein
VDVLGQLNTTLSDRYHVKRELDGGGMARLQHPLIVPVLSAGDAGGLIDYAMPYVEGESLRGRLQREGPLPLTTSGWATWPGFAETLLKCCEGVRLRWPSIIERERILTPLRADPRFQALATRVRRGG